MAISPKLRFHTSHTKFSVVFSIMLYVACNALNIDKLVKWFYGKDGLDYLSLSAYLIFGLCLFIVIFVLLAHRWTIKPLAILLILASAAATYFISKYNVAIDRSMIQNVIHTDLTEVGQLLSFQMVPYIVFLMILPTIVIWLTDITFQARGRYLLGSLKLVSIALFVGIAALYLNYDAIHRAGNVSKKYIVYSLVPVNVISSTITIMTRSAKKFLTSTKKDIEIAGHVSSPDNLVVVLAIGEASRRGNFSIYGYDRRNTNPELQTNNDLHLLNAIAKRGTTLYALPEILEKKGVTLPMMVSKLGIPTSCYVNYTLYDNCTVPGETKVNNCGHGGKCYDEDVVPLLKDNLKTYKSGYSFIVLHLGGGSHGPVYADRYPPEFQKFKPMCNDADVANKCTIEELYNSYDNSILYVDHVLNRIIQELDRSRVPYVFIYLSDHGESLMEDGRMFHGMPPGVPLPKEQAEIPLIVKSSVPISIIKRSEYYQQDVFDTVLDLFSIETTMFDKKGGFIRKRAPDDHAKPRLDRDVPSTD